MFLAAIVAVIFAISCSKKYEPKDKVEQAFMGYVETTFDDPDDFLEITKREKPDTFSTEQLLDLAEYTDMYNSDFPLYTRAKYWKERGKLVAEQPFFVIYPIKTRVIGDKGTKQIKDFYVVKNKDSTLTVFDHYPYLEEVSDTYANFANTVEKMMDVILKAIEMKKNE